MNLNIYQIKDDVNYLIINKNIENNRKQKWFGTLIFAHLILTMMIKLIYIGLLWLFKLSLLCSLLLLFICLLNSMMRNLVEVAVFLFSQKLSGSSLKSS